MRLPIPPRPQKPSILAEACASTAEARFRILVMSAAASSWSSVDHYENFPVASRLLPARIRPAVIAVYRFARHADDLADEGDASPAARLAALGELRSALASATPQPNEPTVIAELRPFMREAGLPSSLFLDLLSAFEQDARGAQYRERADLLDYCRRSANPIGRLMLLLLKVTDQPQRLGQADSICTALQLINFLQDLAIDLGRGRCYLPLDQLARAGLSPVDLGEAIARGTASPELRKVIEGEARWAEALLRDGSALCSQVGWRFGLELRMIVAGGLRILEKLRQSGFDPIARRPRLRRMDAPALLRLAFRQGQ